jgi:hypothetical protein
MRRGRLGAVNSIRGGGCRSGPAQAQNVGRGARVGMQIATMAMSGDTCSPVVDGTNWFRSGTEFLQHASELAVGAHLPFKQQSATLLRAAPAAKQSKGPRSRATTIRLTAM